MEFPTDPGIITSISLRYLQAVLGFFQNARCITVGRSYPASVRVSSSPDLKECIVNAVRSPASRACTFRAFVISGADMGVLPPHGCSRVWSSGDLGERYPSVMFHPSAVPTAIYCSTVLTRHVDIRCRTVRS